MKNSVLHWLPAFFYAAFIFFLSHQSDPVSADWMPDYIAHFIEYALFAFTLIWGTTTGFRQDFVAKKAAFVLIIVFVYAVSDEVHQTFVPNRQLSVGDLGADLAGALLCVGTAYLRDRRRKQC